MQPRDLIKSKYIEYNIVEHCNLRCFQCDHSSPLLSRKYVSLFDFQRDLEALAQVLCVNEIKLIGGEPLLHPEILNFLLAAKNSRIAERVAVITNGTLLHQMKEEFWQNIDKLQVTIYPGAVIKIDLQELKIISEQWGFDLKIIQRNTFRYTITNVPIEDMDIISRNCDSCELRTTFSCHTIRNGHYFKCSPAPFTKDRLQLYNIDYPHSYADGVSLHDNENLYEDLLNYLTSTKPLQACRYCLGTNGKNLDHYQMKNSKAEFFKNMQNPISFLNLESHD